MNRVAVQVFARLRELAGSDVVTIDLPAGATVADLRREFVRAVPAAGELVARSAVAVNEEYADDDQVIGPVVTVAMIPPVSGG